MQPNCSMAALPDLRTSAAPVTVVNAVSSGTLGGLQLQGGHRAEVRHRKASTARPGMLRLPLLSATALHAACLAGTLMFTHDAPQVAPAVVELVVQPEAAAVEPAPAVRTAGATEPAAAAIIPAEKPDAPAHDESQALPLSPPVARPESEQALAAAEPIVTPAENPPEASALVAEQALAPVEPIVRPAGNPPEASAPGLPVANLPDVPPPPSRPANRLARIAARYHAMTGPPVETAAAPPPTSTSLARLAGNWPRNSASADQGAAAPAHAADQQAALEGRIRDAVQAAVHYPPAARMMGVTGRARVQLDYRNGAVDDPSLAKSSGTPMLDHAAISAAQDAHYPTPPPELAGRLMHFLVWVEFRSA